YLKRYHDQFPQDVGAYERLGDVYTAMGHLAEARHSYEQALARNPEQIRSLLGMSDVQMRSGELEHAFETCRQALQLSRSPEDRSQVTAHLMTHHKLLRQWKQALADTRTAAKEQLKFSAPAITLLSEVAPDAIEVQVKAGAGEDIGRRLRAAAQQSAGGQSSP